jgi:hypothetical protein
MSKRKPRQTSERTERIMKKLSYLPLITTGAAFIYVGVSEWRSHALLKREVAAMYSIEYDTCKKPGGLERARAAFAKAKKKKKEWKKARTFCEVIAEMERGRPSRIRQCNMLKYLKKIRRGF